MKLYICNNGPRSIILSYPLGCCTVVGNCYANRDNYIYYEKPETLDKDSWNKIVFEAEKLACKENNAFVEIL